MTHLLDTSPILAHHLTKQAAPKRIPHIDVRIAGCAAAHQLTLVHRYGHLDAIPSAKLATPRLPPKRRKGEV